MENDDRSVLISLRLHRSLVQQIDDLQDRIVNNGRLTPSGTTSRSEIIRHLIILGMDRVQEGEDDENT
jgi:metal-responsive CopG/Arc/MetJ family transcriptional regulator